VIVLIAETEIAFCVRESGRHTANEVTRNNRASAVIWRWWGRSSPPCRPLTAPAFGVIDGGAIKLIKRVRSIWFHRDYVILFELQIIAEVQLTTAF
jgi:hypothetical protein